MPRERDRLQALAFERRRMLVAFARGSPDEDAGDPVRPCRWVVGSLVLGLVLVAASAVSGVVSGRTSVGWDDHGPVISRHRPHASPSPGDIGPPVVTRPAT